MPSKPNILLLGPSGSGKSCSLEPLFTKYGPQVAYIDTERKGLPFLFDRSKLAFDCECENYKQAQEAMTKAKNCTAARFIVYDSLSKLFDYIGQSCELQYQGYDIWKMYGNFIGKVFEFNKSTEKVIIGVMHDEIVYVDQPQGSRVARLRASIKGNIWEGKVEKEWLIVLYCEPINGKDGVQFGFHTVTNGIHPAKAPMWLKLPPRIPNDVSLVIDKLVEAKMV